VLRPPASPMKHLPNALTIVRILLTPVLLWLLLIDTFWGYASGLGLFIVAAVSDYLDGMLAREYQVDSRLGQFLDPLADKILVLGTFAVLAYLMPRQVPWWGVRSYRRSRHCRHGPTFLGRIARSIAKDAPARKDENDVPADVPHRDADVPGSECAPDVAGHR
jgi:hypothetical protein